MFNYQMVSFLQIQPSFHPSCSKSAPRPRYLAALRCLVPCKKWISLEGLNGIEMRYQSTLRTPQALNQSIACILAWGIYRLYILLLLLLLLLLLFLLLLLLLLRIWWTNHHRDSLQRWSQPCTAMLTLLKQAHARSHIASPLLKISKLVLSVGKWLINPY